MLTPSSRKVALINLQWKIAHGIIGLRILNHTGIETPFLIDLEMACNTAAGGKGLSALLPSVHLASDDASKMHAMLLQIKNLVEECKKPKKTESIKTALAVAEELYAYTEELTNKPAS